MHELSAAALFLLAITAFIVGFSKTGFPGMGILAVPLIAIAVAVGAKDGAARNSSGLLLPLLKETWHRVSLSIPGFL